MRESDFQNALMVELCKLPNVRVWRQPAGRVPAARGGLVKCAPTGAADITGIVGPGGRRIEIECKGPETRVTEQQRKWRDLMCSMGAVALLLRADGSLSLEENVARAVAAVREAIG